VKIRRQPTAELEAALARALKAETALAEARDEIDLWRTLWWGPNEVRPSSAAEGEGS
jgi:hypothetical protein